MPMHPFCPRCGQSSAEGVTYTPPERNAHGEVWRVTTRRAGWAAPLLTSWPAPGRYCAACWAPVARALGEAYRHAKARNVRAEQLRDRLNAAEGAVREWEATLVAHARALAALPRATPAQLRRVEAKLGVCRRAEASLAKAGAKAAGLRAQLTQALADDNREEEEVRA